MKSMIGGARLALVALVFFTQAAFAQQLPAGGSELKFDSSQPSSQTLPVTPPTIVTPTQAPATDKIMSQTPATAGDRQGAEAEVKAAPPARNEFQEFLQKSLGRELKLFGYDLFDEGPSTFAPLVGVPVPSDYVIGPGDEILIRAWGQIDVDVRATVDRNGRIYIPKVGLHLGRGDALPGPERAHPHGGVAHLQELRSGRDPGRVALHPDFRGRAGQKAGQLHGQFALDPGQCAVRLRRAQRQGLDAPHPVEARGPGRDRIRYLRLAAQRRQIERRAAAAGRRDFRAAHRPARRHQRQRQHRRDFRAEGLAIAGRPDCHGRRVDHDRVRRKRAARAHRQSHRAHGGRIQSRQGGHGEAACATATWCA